MTDVPPDPPSISVRFPRPSYEKDPLTRSEYIMAITHFYRGEMSRATQWRMRLDITTNWALVTVVGLLSFSFGDPNHPHIGILIGMVLVAMFLVIEARRFRFYDVWRARVRMLEDNFFGPVLRRDLKSPVKTWGSLVAEDLLTPRFKITRLQAIRARLLSSYAVLFVILIVSWFLKLVMHPTAYTDGSDLIDRMRLGPVSGWVTLVLVTALYLYLAVIVFFVTPTRSSEEEYWVATQ